VPSESRGLRLETAHPTLFLSSLGGTLPSVKWCNCIAWRRNAMLTVMTICSTGEKPYALCGRGLRGR
jgi:hypothetical protein